MEVTREDGMYSLSLHRMMDNTLILDGLLRNPHASVFHNASKLIYIFFFLGDFTLCVLVLLIILTHAIKLLG